MISGGGQSATIGAAFGASLVVSVLDSNNVPVPGQTVTLTAPATGASLATTPLTTATDGNGQATFAPGANHTIGGYLVTIASGTASTTASFTNTRITLTVSGITAGNKIYDGTTTATLDTTGATLSGVLSGDTVTLVTSGATGAFSDPNLGTGKTVTISGLSLSGAAAGNYMLPTPQAATTANITVGANPVPVITGLNPVLAEAGSQAFTLTVSGVNFVSGAALQWNGSTRATTVVSSTQLTAVITAADVASVGTANVTVVNPTPGGGASAAFKFAIDGTSSAISVTAQSTSLDVQAGQSASVAVTFSSTAQVTQISATCLNLPAGTTCTYDSSSHTVTIQTSSSTPLGSYQVLVIFTVTQQIGALRHQRTLLASWVALLGLPIGLLWIGSTRKRVFRLVILGLLGLCLAISLITCGGTKYLQSTQSTTTTSQSSTMLMLNVH